MNLGVAHPKAAIVAIDFDEVRQVAALSLAVNITT